VASERVKERGMTKKPWVGGVRKPGIAITAVLAFTACDVFSLDTLNDDRDRLNDARERWENEGFFSYEFVLDRDCFCSIAVRPARIVVQSGIILSITAVDEEDPLAAEEESYYFSIEGLFDFIEDAIAQGAAGLDVRYDEESGYPASIYVNYVRGTSLDDVRYNVSALMPTTEEG
jgi:hypothetical protein